jgi:nitroreductase
MSASETVTRSPQAVELILSRASAVTLKEPGPTPEDLTTILRAGTRAPDHGKVQPWRFIVVSGEARERLGDLMVETAKARDPQLSEIELKRERDKIFRAPTIVVAGVKYAPSKIPAVEQHTAVAAACENMILVASALGYGTMWKTGAPAYDDTVKQFFGLEPSDAIVGFVYLGTTDVAPKSVRETKFDDVVTYL